MAINDYRIRINESMRQVRFSNKSGSHENCIRLNPSCSAKHNMEIVKRCLQYRKLQIPFYTEIIWITGGRADIFLPSLGLIEEILCTETDEMFEEKLKTYPQMFKINKVRI